MRRNLTQIGIVTSPPNVAVYGTTGNGRNGNEAVAGGSQKHLLGGCTIHMPQRALDNAAIRPSVRLSVCSMSL